jgi:hypothetical protein
MLLAKSQDKVLFFWTQSEWILVIVPHDVLLSLLLDGFNLLPKFANLR